MKNLSKKCVLRIYYSLKNLIISLNQLVSSCFCTMSWLTCAILHVLTFPNNSNLSCIVVVLLLARHTTTTTTQHAFCTSVFFCEVLHSTFLIIFSLHFMSHHVCYFHQWSPSIHCTPYYAMHCLISMPYGTSNLYDESWWHHAAGHERQLIPKVGIRADFFR